MTDGAELTPQQVRQIDQICDRFEAELKSGTGPKIEAHLDGVENELQTPLLSELLHLEMAYRGARDETVELDAYRDRFPDHTNLIESALNAADVGLETAPHQGSSMERLTPQDFPVDFGDYVLLDEIARGGMGVVYKARQKSLNKVVALKMILSGQFATPEAITRFRKEAEAVANLEHPNIVPVFEVGEHAGQQFFSLGFVQGESLQQRLKDGPFPPRKAAEIICTVAQAVHFAGWTVPKGGPTVPCVLAGNAQRRRRRLPRERPTLYPLRLPMFLPDL